MIAERPRAPERYADQTLDWLVDLGYTHCFFVAGGNIMHLLNGARSRFTCVPFVHEVACGIAAEYFNAVGAKGRAFALVTAGPGMTNIVTALAGAFLESRELLVLGGQVKSTDLACGGIRQRGIQEIDGLALAAPVCVQTLRIERPVDRATFVNVVERGRSLRPGPVFIDFCLDAQGAPIAVAGERAPASADFKAPFRERARNSVDEVAALLAASSRPVILIGGGVSRESAAKAMPALRAIGAPVQTTWNGIDRIPADEEVYAGRPNTWGQRFANVILQQADLVIALGTRLGLQQTGFAWEEFVPIGKLVQVDLDEAELAKGHPRVDLAIACDADTLLEALTGRTYPSFEPWLRFCQHVREILPTSEAANVVRPGYVNPYDFYSALSRYAEARDILIPCSSGGANSTGLQAIEQRNGQIIVTDKGLASMGYGLSGAIGAALAFPDRRTIVVEGDGGFIQNAQELGTVAVNGLNLKIFIFANDGYASIRTTQKNYFGGAYVGCDTSTGLGFPDFPKLFDAFGIPSMTLAPGPLSTETFDAAMASSGPFGFIVPVDPEQMYFPKITSRVTESGSMESNPLHLMTPELPAEIAADVLRYLNPASVTS